MKFVHLSDLHLGKRVNEFSMIEEQRYILQEILHIIEEEKPEGVVIAGDVYDKAVPGAEAVALLDWFLTKLSKMGQPVFLISGNHDSAERIAFGADLMENSQIYVSKVYNGTVKPIRVKDDYGEVFVYLLPFVKPVHVRNAFPEEQIDTYTDAISCAIQHMNLDLTQRNVLVTHQFVTGASRCDSEEVSVGGSDNVDGSVFAPFDYVALGHIHGPQNVGASNIRYCGTPLKYSFSEVKHKKSVTVVELKKKGELEVRTVPLVPRRDLVELQGTYEEVTSRSYYEALDQQAYIRMILKDEEEILDGIGKLRAIYPNIMRLEYDNKRTRSSGEVSGAVDVQTKSELELFEEFYELQNNQLMSEEQKAFVKNLLEQITGGVK